MKEEQKIYIKGNLERGSEIIKMLIDFGGRNSHSLNGRCTNAYYFINPNGIIVNNYLSGSEVFSYVKEFYKEIKLLKWKPKNNVCYYRINWIGEVAGDIWYGTCDDETGYQFGNVFKTRKEAELARDKIKEILNKHK